MNDVERAFVEAGKSLSLVWLTEGSGRYRIAPGRTGFDNLAIAGDWTACGLDAGCLEAATRSGVLAARAVRSGDVGGAAARRPR